jgi:Ca-activated chloride channel family protein
VFPTVELAELRFGQPAYLWLLAVSALLLCLWVWRLVVRRTDIRKLGRRRLLPATVSERLALIGDLPFWLCLILALSCAIVALSQPQGPATVLREGGIDIVVLQDASASMRVRDVPGDRWQRSMRFLRTLGDSLSWRDDRVALCAFARIAAPQIRLTRDPNTIFFFLDHLELGPPFRLEDDSSWDTNLERGIGWGLRIIERDEEMNGRSSNAKLMVVVTDGEVWSGAMERSIEMAIMRNVPIFVIGVGTLAGGRMPTFIGPDGKPEVDPETPLFSQLEREGLQQIAQAAGGQYFELDREDDRTIANTIIDFGKRRSPSLSVSAAGEPLYWYFLLYASLFVALGLVFLRERADLWIQLIGVGAVLAVLVQHLW